MISQRCDVMGAAEACEWFNFDRFLSRLAIDVHERVTAYHGAAAREDGGGGGHDEEEADLDLLLQGTARRRLDLRRKESSDRGRKAAVRACKIVLRRWLSVVRTLGDASFAPPRLCGGPRGGCAATAGDVAATLAGFPFRFLSCPSASFPSAPAMPSCGF